MSKKNARVVDAGPRTAFLVPEHSGDQRGRGLVHFGGFGGRALATTQSAVGAPAAGDEAKSLVSVDLFDC